MGINNCQQREVRFPDSDVELIEKAKTLPFGWIHSECLEKAQSEEAKRIIEDIARRQYHFEEYKAGMG